MEQMLIDDRKLIITIDGSVDTESDITRPQKANDIFWKLVNVIESYKDNDILEIEINLHNLNITSCYIDREDQPILKPKSKRSISKRIVSKVNQYISACASEKDKGCLLIPALKKIRKLTINLYNCLIMNHNRYKEESNLTIVPVTIGDELESIEINIEDTIVQYTASGCSPESRRYLIIEPQIYNTSKRKVTPKMTIRVRNSVFREAGIYVKWGTVVRCRDNDSASEATGKLIIENCKFIDYIINPIYSEEPCGDIDLLIKNTTFINFSDKQCEGFIMDLLGAKQIVLQNIVFKEEQPMPTYIEHYILVECSDKLFLGPIKFDCDEDYSDTNPFIYVTTSVNRIYLTGELKAKSEKPVLVAPIDRVIISSPINKPA